MTKENKNIIAAKSKLKKSIVNAKLDLGNDNLKVLKNLIKLGIPGVNKLNSSGMIIIDIYNFFRIKSIIDAGR